jgi:hypothetical protein
MSPAARRLAIVATGVVVAVMLVLVGYALRAATSPSGVQSVESTAPITAVGCKTPKIKLPDTPPGQVIDISKEAAYDGKVPPPGWYQQPYSNSSDKLETVMITHTMVTCGQPFQEHVDLTFLGDWPTCKTDPRVPEAIRRPCDEPFKQGPDQRTATLNGPAADQPGAKAWRPVEGKDWLKVDCQAISNGVVSQGEVQDMRPMSASNVWNQIHDPRIPGGVGWVPDIWMGNAGFRGKLCTPGDGYSYTLVA